MFNCNRIKFFSHFLFPFFMNILQGDNIADLLHSLGLGKYYINFQAEEVSKVLPFFFFEFWTLK